MRSCFSQAEKWELIEKNPAIHATVPKHKYQKREIWTAETLLYALEVCDDEILKLALNLSFAASLRIRELLGLTWDCVDISEEALEENRAYLYVNKELQRVSKKALGELKSVLGDEYQDYDLVLTSPFGTPASASQIRKSLKKLIEEHNLPNVVFHSLRHTSVTYKLKLNGGDIKAVQGDSGHSQVNMVTDVYSHIIDEDRKRNAQLFEDAFYGKKNLNPKIHETDTGKMLAVPEGVDAEALMKVLANPEMTALLMSLAKTIQK